METVVVFFNGIHTAVSVDHSTKNRLLFERQEAAFFSGRLHPTVVLSRENGSGIH
jgi:hypothetical protein